MKNFAFLLAVLIIAATASVSLADCERCINQVRNSSNAQEAMHRAFVCAQNLSMECQARVSSEIRAKFGIIVDIFRVR